MVGISMEKLHGLLSQLHCVLAHKLINNLLLLPYDHAIGLQQSIDKDFIHLVLLNNLHSRQKVLNNCLILLAGFGHSSGSTARDANSVAI